MVQVFIHSDSQWQAVFNSLIQVHCLISIVKPHCLISNVNGLSGAGAPPLRFETDAFLSDSDFKFFFFMIVVVKRFILTYAFKK